MPRKHKTVNGIAAAMDDTTAEVQPKGKAAAA